MRENVEALAERINNDALNYEYPNAPGTLFLAILSRHSAIEDEAGLADMEMPDSTYAHLEIKHLTEWLNEIQQDED